MQLILYKAPGSIWDKGIRVVSGERYPCKPDIFAAAYYAVSE